MNLSKISSAFVFVSFVFAGCVTGDGSQKKPAVAKGSTASAAADASGVTLKKEKDIQGVWLAPGFNFSGHGALFVESTKYAGAVRNNEERERAQAIRGVQSEIIAAAQTTGLFSTVQAGSPAGKGSALRMSNTITKFEKGGGAARYFAGVYGAGQPHTRVHGEIHDGQKLVCVYEVERSGDSGIARMGGGFMGDDVIIATDIKDLAKDLAAFFVRASKK